MRLQSLVFLPLLVPAALTAQADSVRAVVEGKVLDPVGGPLANTEIIWQTDRRSVMSRADGSFSLVVPVRGVTVILVRRPGYSAVRLGQTRATMAGFPSSWPKC